MTGTVEKFDPAWRYGFITADDGRRVFVHASEVVGERRALHAGLRVEFDVQETTKGPEAVGVTRLAATSRTDR